MAKFLSLSSIFFFFQNVDALMVSGIIRYTPNFTQAALPSSLPGVHSNLPGLGHLAIFSIIPNFNIVLNFT